jgi:hypothetical protein
MSWDALWRDPRRVLSVLALVGYVAIAWSVSNLYPFSVFDMFAGRTASASRVVARDAGGRVAEVDRFVAWRCDGPVDVRPQVCAGEPGFDYTVYTDREAADYIASHRGDDPSASPVDVVRRIWRLSGEDGPPAAKDCLIARCTAVAR